MQAVERGRVEDWIDARQLQSGQVEIIGYGSRMRNRLGGGTGVTPRHPPAPPDVRISASGG
jgi:hypothetical protein